MTAKYYDRIVIGAGLSGVLAAHRAEQRGERVLVIEAAQRHGGALAPIHIAGTQIDAGAEAFSTVDTATLTLIQQFGLSDHIVSPRNIGSRLITAPHQIHLIPHGFLGIPASLDDPDLQRLISPSGLALAKQLDQQPFPNTRGMTVADLVLARLGPEFLSDLVDPLITGVHGAPAHTISAQHALAPLLNVLPLTRSLCAAAARVRSNQPRPGAAVATLRGGLHRLPTVILARLRAAGAHCIFGQTQTRITPVQNGWSVHSGQHRWQARFLSIAAGARTNELAETVLFGEAPHNRTPTAVSRTLVLAHVESTQLRSFPLGTGALISARANTTAQATTHVNAKWQWIDEQLPHNTHIIRLSYDHTTQITPADVTQILDTDLTLVYGTSDHIICDASIVRWPSTLGTVSPTPSQDRSRTAVAAEEAEIELCDPASIGNGVRHIVGDHLRKSLG